MEKLTFRKIKHLDPGPIDSQWQSQDLNQSRANSKLVFFQLS